MKKIRKITKGILVAAMLVVSIIPILTITFFLNGHRRNAFLDIISEWIADLMKGLD